jgi:hypothetical protein
MKAIYVSTIALLTLAFSTGCEDKSAPAAAAGSATTPTPTAVPKPAKVGPNEFGTKVVDSACKAFSSCKNEELRGLTEGTLLMVAAFGLMGPNMEPDPALKAIDEKMKADKRKFLNADECTSIGAKLADKIGFSSAVLAKLVQEKRVTFDEDKATQCIAELAKGPKSCSQETKLPGDELKLSQLEVFEKKYDAEMDSYTKACEEVIKGAKKVGEACEYDVECVEGSCGKDPSKKGEMVCKPKKH